jgi:hypothetical protein
MYTTDQAKRIEMTYLRKSGDLKGWSWRRISWNYNGRPSGCIDVKIATGSDGDNYYMELDYKWKDHDAAEWTPIDYKVRLQPTSCGFGGRRWWFICPNLNCRRRNSILYQSGRYFVCRKCAGLKYESQNYSGKYSFLRDLFEAEDYERSIKRWYYRGKPTRKHRRFLKMTRGMSENERLDECLKALRA